MRRVNAPAPIGFIKASYQGYLVGVKQAIDKRQGINATSGHRRHFLAVGVETAQAQLDPAFEAILAMGFYSLKQYHRKK